MNSLEKLDLLKSNLSEYDGLAVAFSAGVDSTFLLYVAKLVLKNNLIAITAKSHLIPDRELKAATMFCKEHGIDHFILDFNELEVEGFSQNPSNRCYLCKNQLFSSMKSTALEKGFESIAEGSNTDDEGDYRPGMTAIAELRILSPLRDVRLSKQDIRDLSHEFGLPTWNKPSLACLASRIPYGEEITVEKISKIDKAELFLLNIGFDEVRVRNHNGLARIEVGVDEIDKFFDFELRKSVVNKLKEIGFDYISLDLCGYKTGSMNAPVTKNLT